MDSEPVLLNALALPESDIGSFEWDPEVHSDLLTVSGNGQTVEWTRRKRKPGWAKGGPAWLPAPTRARLHSGDFRWDFVVEELASYQVGVGFMLLWNVGVDWGFFGYLGASSSAWAYDPFTGDVVTSTESIEGNLPRFANGKKGVVSVLLELPRDAEGSARFQVNGIDSRRIALPKRAVVRPAACLLKATQRVTLAGFQRS